MSKLLALVILGLMAIQVIKPLGLPGLRRRRDCWKMAVAATGTQGTSRPAALAAATASA